LRFLTQTVTAVVPAQAAVRAPSANTRDTDNPRPTGSMFKAFVVLTRIQSAGGDDH
jgi:hypothetical protein